jgi:protein-L-isoaspartate(D-aspartate) O-methyltransferase
MVLARLIQSLLLSLPSDKPFKVLNIAGGAGYGAALLSHVGANVIFLEEMQDLADQALQNLSRAGYASHVICVHGDFAQGVIQHAPFDAILIEGVFAQLPDTLIQQLREGGILVGLEGVNAAPKAMLYTKSTQHMSGRALFSAHGAMLKAFAPVENFAF